MGYSLKIGNLTQSDLYSKGRGSINVILKNSEIRAGQKYIVTFLILSIGF